MDKKNDMKKESRFCAACGNKTEWVIREVGEESVELCPKCGMVFFRNSVPCVGGLVIKDGKILLVKRAIDPFIGYWDIPGGFLEESEHPENGVVREVFEETGFIVVPEELIGFYMDTYSGEGSCTTLNIYFICSIKDGKPKLSAENDEIEWFDLEELPKNIAFIDHVSSVLTDLIEKLEILRLK
ncbi:NUDIX hydrolase [bacterium]|nr:NUDIX hydrolase [bacterium]